MERLTATHSTHAAASFGLTHVAASHLNADDTRSRSRMVGATGVAILPPSMPNQNLLLAALPPTELARLTPNLEQVEMPLGKSICESGAKFRYAYFPTTAIISLHHFLASGASIASAGVGNEGVVGISIFMGGDTTPSSAVVQTAGYAYRLAGRLLKSEFRRAGLMQDLLLRYTQALITQTSQTAACNRHHSVDQQFCRWLLQTLDRASSCELTVTQESIAGTLGVRRECITSAAGKLQRAGLISCRRGHITVLERSGLELRACDCYAIIRNELDRLLGGVVRHH